MSDQTSPDAGAVAGEALNPEAEQDKAALDPNLDTQADEGDESGEARTFTQAEVNDIVKKEKARAEAKAERRAMRAQEQRQPVQQTQDGRPTRHQGEDDDVYADRLSDWKTEQRKHEEQKKSLVTKTEKLYADAAKIPGFDVSEFNDVMASNPFSGEFSRALIDSDQAPKLMAYLAANPDDAERIAALSPARQAAEIGKLETRLSASTTTPRASSPITPIGSRGGATPTLENASLDDYITLRKKQGAGWARR